MRKIATITLCLITITANFNLGFAQKRKFMEVELYDYGWESDMATLDNVAIQLQNDPNLMGHFIFYGAQRERRGEIARRIQCMKTYLIENRGISGGRIRMVHGGNRKSMTMEVWLIPRGERDPNATPTVSPKDVIYVRGKVRYGCDV